jgi:hypothetical protein
MNSSKCNGCKNVGHNERGDLLCLSSPLPSTCLLAMFAGDKGPVLYQLMRDVKTCPLPNQGEGEPSEGIALLEAEEGE